METLGSLASVIAAIRDEAAAEVEKLEKTAPEIRSEPVVISGRESRIAAAHRDNRERIAQQEWESRRLVVEQREAWIARVREAAHQRWGEFDSEDLIREALERLPGDNCEVTVRPASRSGAAGEGPSSAPRPPSPRERGEGAVIFKTADISGGCIVTCGGVTFDNSFEARELRFEAEWRRALAALYRT